MDLEKLITSPEGLEIQGPSGRC